MATIHIAGQCQVEQDGRSASLTPGAIVRRDSTRPFGFSFDGPFEQLIVQVPRSAVPAIGLISSTVSIAAGCQTGSAELDRERVMHHLRRAFRDSHLDSDTVARGCHLSRRTLFRLFSDAPRSLAEELREIRACRGATAPSRTSRSLGRRRCRGMRFPR